MGHAGVLPYTWKTGRRGENLEHAGEEMKYIIEVRDDEGHLDFEREKQVRTEHPYLFSKSEFTIDDLCHYASFGQRRNNPSGPYDIGKFYKSIGVTYRKKYW